MWLRDKKAKGRGGGERERDGGGERGRERSGGRGEREMWLRDKTMKRKPM